MRVAPRTEVGVDIASDMLNLPVPTVAMASAKRVARVLLSRRVRSVRSSHLAGANVPFATMSDTSSAVEAMTSRRRLFDGFVERTHSYAPRNRGP
jgi:hypothetical protein